MFNLSNIQKRPYVQSPKGFTKAQGNILSKNPQQDTFVKSAAISNDIEQNNPLNIYKSNRIYNRPLDIYTLYWGQRSPQNSRHCAWKMHLYADNHYDYQRMVNAVAPYLDDADVMWKMAKDDSIIDKLKTGKQKGKAFTIYPQSVENFKQIARDLDYIIRNNNLSNNDMSNIIGDRKLGNTGRIFYRYELNSGKYKDCVFYTDKYDERKIYHAIYDANRGENNYMPSDMRVKDDPFYNFDTSIKKDILGIPVLSIPHDQEFYILEKNKYYPLNEISDIILPSEEYINVNNSVFQNFLNKMYNDSGIIIGRGENCPIRTNPDNKTTSKKHLILYKTDNKFYIMDCSTNGTVVKKA